MLLPTINAIPRPLRPTKQVICGVKPATLRLLRARPVTKKHQIVASYNAESVVYILHSQRFFTEGALPLVGSLISPLLGDLYTPKIRQVLTLLDEDLLPENSRSLFRHVRSLTDLDQDTKTTTKPRLFYRLHQNFLNKVPSAVQPARFNRAKLRPLSKPSGL
jgi:hypothetical protein